MLPNPLIVHEKQAKNKICCRVSGLLITVHGDTSSSSRLRIKPHYRLISRFR